MNDYETAHYRGYTIRKTGYFYVVKEAKKNARIKTYDTLDGATAAIDRMQRVRKVVHS